MLTYEDCLAFSELTPAAVAAIAQHEHVPAMLALELGAHLCSTRTGRETVRRMILEDIDRSLARGNHPAAASLRRTLAQFDEACPQTVSPVETGLDEDRASVPTASLDQRIQALGFDAAAVPWVRRRVQAYLTAMMRQAGLDRAHLPEGSTLELLVAETRCAVCDETEGCRRFLARARAGEAVPEFCPNAGLFQRLSSLR
jgi:hypothetical protein